MTETLLSAEDVAGLVERLDLILDGVIEIRTAKDGCVGFRLADIGPGSYGAIEVTAEAAISTISTLAARVEEAERELGASRSQPSSTRDHSLATTDAEPSAASEITITRAEARRLVNYAFMASNANWTPFIKENGVGCEDSPWVEFLRIADRLWTVLFPDHPIRAIDPRLPYLAPDHSGSGLDWKSRALAAEAETARMRKALEEIAGGDYRIVSGSLGPLMDIGWAQCGKHIANIAKAALSPASEGGE